jgi:uncharacterized phage protein (TIGR02218 family)
MSYNTYAVSNDDLVEVALYEFNLGTTYWRYTSADRDITYDGDLYTAVAIKDNGIRQSGSPGDTDEFVVEIDATLPPPLLYRATPPSEELWLTVRRMHHGDVDGPIYWIGTIMGASQTDEVTSEMRGQILGPSLRRGGLRLLWQRQCTHMVYGPGCNVDRALHAVVATITAKTDTTITATEIAGEDVGHFDGGFVEWTRADGSKDRRPLQAGGTADTVYFLTTTYGLDVGDTVTLYPGCDGTYPTCEAKFSNEDNFGGVRHLIEQNPYLGTRFI